MLFGKKNINDNLNPNLRVPLTRPNGQVLLAPRNIWGKDGG